MSDAKAKLKSACHWRLIPITVAVVIVVVGISAGIYFGVYLIGSAEPVATADLTRRTLQKDIVAALKSDDWTKVEQGFKAAKSNGGLIIGDATGVRYESAHGLITLDDAHPIMSQSKYITGLTIMRVIATTSLDMTKRPQDYLDAWPKDSKVTLSHLVSFTTGFKEGTPPGCAYAEEKDWEDCIVEISKRPLEHDPGTSYIYGPWHLVVAAGMAQKALGKPLTTAAWIATVDELVFKPSKIKESAKYGSAVAPLKSFPDFSGGNVMSALQWQKIMAAVMYGKLLTPSALVDFHRDRTLNVKEWRGTFGGTHGVGLGAWHYCAGHWLACDKAAEKADSYGYLKASDPAQAACVKENTPRVLHSVGMFGWYAWEDETNNYYGVLAQDGHKTGENSGVVAGCVVFFVFTPLIAVAIYLCTAFLCKCDTKKSEISPFK